MDKEMSPAFRAALGKAQIRAGRKHHDKDLIKRGQDNLSGKKITVEDGLKMAGQTSSSQPVKLDRTPTNDPNGSNHLVGMSRKR
jgi:hypothetical protein